MESRNFWKSVAKFLFVFLLIIGIMVLADKTNDLPITQIALLTLAEFFAIIAAIALLVWLLKWLFFGK